MKGSNNNLRAASILIGIGMMLFVFRYSIPANLVPFATLPLLLLGIGLLVGVLTKFRHPAAFVLMGIGGLFLYNTDLPLQGGWTILPLIFVAAGILSLLVTKLGVQHSNTSQDNGQKRIDNN